MSKGKQNSKVDRVIELFREKKLYQTLKKPAALLIDLILHTGATPVDIINIQPEHFNRNKQQLTLYPHKKKTVQAYTHQLSQETVEAFFSLRKPLSNYSIRRLQQLLKEETQRIGSELTHARSLRKEYLKRIISQNKEELSKKTQLISLQHRTILTTSEQEKLKTTSYSKRDKALILTLLQTGLRVSEVLLLQQRHIKGNHLHLDPKITYNNKERILPLPPILHTHTSKKNFLFSSKKPLTQRRFEQICKEVAKAAQIDELTPSILRATAIYNLSLKLGQEELLNQTGLQTSTLYTHGFLERSLDSTTTTTPVITITSSQPFDETGDDDFMYHRSKLRDGGDTDE